MAEIAGCTAVLRKMYQGIMHSTCRQEMEDLQDFLEGVIPDKDDLPPPTL